MVTTERQSKLQADRTTWVLVANASRADVFSCAPGASGLIPVECFAHELGRAKRSDLVSDKPGHAARSRGGRRTALQADVDPKRHEQERFAARIAQFLAHAHAQQRFDALVLIASAQFLGQLKHQLGHAVSQSLTGTLAKDYTASSRAELTTDVRKLLRA
jgi:protein required for attachment to host cells